MEEDHAFQMVLLGLVLLSVPVTLAFRVRSRTDERLDRRQEGLFILVALRAAGIAFWVGLILFLARPSWMAWASLRLPGVARWGGALLYIAGAILLFWTLRHIGRNLTDTVVTRRNHTLVTDGPYAWVRNPFYDSAAILVLATSMVAANWFLLFTGTLVIAMLAIRTRIEEEKLVARFGDAYSSYMRRTGRFLPRARRAR